MQILFRTPDENGVSPFETNAFEVARSSNVLLASPYISLEFVRDRLFDLALNWKIVSDLPEWLAATPQNKREELITFIQRNSHRIRHQSLLHAKVLIGDKLSLIHI